MTPRPAILAATTLLLFCLTPAHPQAPDTPDTRPRPVSAAISPDGSLVAWTLRQREGATLHLTELANPDPAKERLIAPNGATNCSNTAPVWSPDSNTLAFTSTCTGKEEKPGQEQLFLWSKATGDIKQLTHLTGNIAQAAWSPDSKSIAFLFVENATRSAGALDAMKPWSGVIGEDGVEIQRAYGVDVASGHSNWLTPQDLHVYEFAWAPNSKEIAFVGAKPPGENNWWVAHLFTQGLVWDENGHIPDGKHIVDTLESVPKSLLDTQKIPGPLHGLQIAVPRFSPDGKRLAFIGGLMSDQGSTGGDVYVIDSDGKSPPIDITPNIDGTPTYEAWLDNDTIGMVEDRRGHLLLPDYTVSTRTPKPNTGGSSDDLGEIALSGGPIKNAISYTSFGEFAFIKSGLTHGPEVYAGPFNKLTQITHLNDAVKAGPRIESIEWQNDGFNVQGWLTFPTGYDSHKKYPMIVTVHGGPSSSAYPRGATWAPLGYFEFQPNPRGSFGQGEKFTQANIKDFGYGDLRDILTGIDAIEKKFPVDDHRLGLTGWSYGGFMSMFAETQTNRFRAIVAGAGIANWQSYYGENSIDQWMVPFFGASVYDDPAIYAKSSALTFIKQSKTPMLIIVGDRDGECPAPQSFEMWHALRAEGVKTQLVVYPNEGHRFSNPGHIRDRNNRTLKWFADNLK